MTFIGYVLAFVMMWYMWRKFYPDRNPTVWNSRLGRHQTYYEESIDEVIMPRYGEDQ